MMIFLSGFMVWRALLVRRRTWRRCCLKRDAGQHGGGERDGLDVVTLAEAGLARNDAVNKRTGVVGQLIGSKIHLADGAGNVAVLIELVIDAAGLHFADGLGGIVR